MSDKMENAFGGHWLDENGPTPTDSLDTSDSSDSLTSRSREHQIFIDLAQSTANVVGMDFFDRLCQKLCETLEVSSAFICRCIHGTDDGRVRTISFWHQGRKVPDVEYSIFGTPCEKVYHDGEAFFHCGVQELFPDDLDLVELNAQSYYGIALKNSRGAMIGHIGILNEKPMVESVAKYPAIGILAARVAAELQRIESEFKLTQAEVKIQHSQRLASIGTLAAGIAHEINNPLEAIMLSAETAMDFSKDDHESLEDCLQTVIESADRASKIVKGVLRFSRQQTSEKLRCSVVELVKSAMGHSEVERKKQDAEYCLMINDSENVWIHGSPIELEQVFDNLLRNALQANQDSFRRIEISVDSEPGWAVVSITDFGPGIQSQDQSRIFDPFFTTRANSGGNGLGLSITHGIVTEHGGKIEFQNNIEEEGRITGTTFRVSLPLVEDQTDPSYGVA